MLKTFIAGLCPLLVYACSAGPVDRDPTIQIEGMIMENQTQMYLSRVRLLVPTTGQFVSCGNIPPGSMCSTGFPGAAYKGNPVEITWSQGGQIHSTGQFAMQLPSELNETRPAVVRVVISGPGSAGALIIQSDK